MKTLISFLLLLLSAGSCGTSAARNNAIDPPTPPTPPTPPGVSKEAQKEFAASSTDFAFRFLRQIDKNEKGDWFVSPLSLQFLLDMLLNGAQGKTAGEIAAVLGSDPARLDTLNAWSQQTMGILPLRDSSVKLTLAGAIFLNDQAALLPTYVKKMETFYNATVENLNFADEENALQRINGWASEQTNGLIPGVLDQVNPGMLAYLLNALYFKGSWEHRFSKDLTGKEPFHLASGREKPVDMMRKTRKYAYAELDVCRSVRLDYGNGAYAMTVILPTEGHSLDEVTASLDAGLWDKIRRRDMETRVDLWLPRFEAKYHVKLNDILSTMGMPRSFTQGQADFKLMSPMADYLDFVQQDAIIKVDEEGTEAAAVSSAGMALATAVPEPRLVVFHADRPFLYLISDTRTGVILFAGKYTGQ